MKELYDNRMFNVLFYGNWQPLHGLDIVAKAITELNKSTGLKFTIIGSENGNNIRKNAENHLKKHGNKKNYRFLNTVPIKELIEYIKQSDLVLAGGYAKGEKEKTVIRNATFEATAQAKLVLIPDTKANKEYLKDGKSCIMCKLGDYKSLASKILKVQTMC